MICFSTTNLVSVILVSGWEERRYFVLQVEQVIPVGKLCSFIQDLGEVLRLLVVVMLLYDQGGGEGGQEDDEEDGEGGEVSQ